MENHLSIYKKLRELLINGEIRGVMTKSYGPAMRTASYLSEKFGTPFLPFERSMDFIDKKIMKEVFRVHGIRSPRTYPITSRKHITRSMEIAFPIIAKPSVGHAKKGVDMLNSMDELKRNWSRYGGRGGYIFEEFIRGDEIITLGFIHKKRYHLIEITDKKTTPYPHFVDVVHISPSQFSHLNAEIQEIGQKVAQAFEIETSPLIMEFIIDDGKIPYIIEAVPEFGGEFLSDVLVPAKSGYNFLLEAVRAETNSGFRPPVYKMAKGSVVVKYITGKKGVLASFNPLAAKAGGGIIYSRIFKEIGAVIREPETNLDRVGVIVARGITPEDAMKKALDAETMYDIRYTDEG